MRFVLLVLLLTFFIPNVLGSKLDAYEIEEQTTNVYKGLDELDSFKDLGNVAGEEDKYEDIWIFYTDTIQFYSSFKATNHLKIIEERNFVYDHFSPPDL